MSLQAERHVLIVLGMHRSGTSALGGVISRLGVAEPEHPMGGDPDNPRGYYESIAVTEFHDRLLGSLDSHWSDWRELDPAWISTSEGQEAVRELRALLETEFGDSGLFLVKDPRMCRLVPLWLTTLEAMEVSPRFVLPIRSPAEVAASLASRSRHRLTAAESTLLWLRHVLDAEFHSRGHPRVLTRFEDLLADWRTVTSKIAHQLSISWPRSPADAAGDIDGFLSSDLRHQRVDASASNEQRAASHGWAARAYAALDGLMEEIHNEDAFAMLDEVRASLNTASQAFAPLMVQATRDLRADHDRLADELARLRSTRATEAAVHVRSLAKLDRELSRVSVERRELAESLRERFVELAVLSARAVSAERQARTSRAEVREQKVELRVLRAEIKALSALVRSSRLGSVQRLKARVRRNPGNLSSVDDKQLLRRSPLFDADWYLRQNPEVQEAGLRPVVHYLRHGAEEGRDPGPVFSTSGYLERYPHVRESGINPLVHFLRHGREEGLTFLDLESEGEKDRAE